MGRSYILDSPPGRWMPVAVRMPACHSRRFKGERPIGAPPQANRANHQGLGPTPPPPPKGPRHCAKPPPKRGFRPTSAGAGESRGEVPAPLWVWCTVFSVCTVLFWHICLWGRNAPTRGEPRTHPPPEPPPPPPHSLTPRTHPTPTPWLLEIGAHKGPFLHGIAPQQVRLSPPPPPPALPGFACCSGWLSTSACAARRTRVRSAPALTQTSRRRRRLPLTSASSPCTSGPRRPPSSTSIGLSAECRVWALTCTCTSRPTPPPGPRLWRAAEWTPMHCWGWRLRSRTTACTARQRCVRDPHCGSVLQEWGGGGWGGGCIRTGGSASGGAPCAVCALCETQGDFGPVSPDAQADRGKYCVPTHWTASIITQSKNSDDE